MERTSKSIDDDVLKEAAKQFDNLDKAGLLIDFNTLDSKPNCEDGPQCKTLQN